VTAQILDRGLTCFRIGDPDGQYSILDATGSTIAPGRWNTPASPMIYASKHYSTALLEKLVHGSGALPPKQHFITITIPRGLTYEVFVATNGGESSPFGPRRWLRAARPGSRRRGSPAQS
jgi:RES domain-containing protein